MLSPSPPKPGLVAILFAVLCLIWGSTWSVIQIGLKDFPPFQGVAYRLAIALVFMTLLAARLAKREGGRRPPRGLAVLMGLGNFSLSYAIIYWTEQHVPSSLVSLIWAIFPIFVAIGAHFVLPGERFTLVKFVGSAVAFFGVFLLVGKEAQNLDGEGASAALLVLLSPLISTVGTLAVKRHGKDVSSLLLNRDGMVVGLGLMAALAWGFERDTPAHWTTEAVLCLVYLAIVGTVVAFSIWFWLMRTSKASTLSLVSYVTPAVAVGLGVFRGEEVTWTTLMAAICILGGVALVALPLSSRVSSRRPDEHVISASSAGGDTGCAHQ